MSRGAKVVLTILGALLALGVAGVLWFVAVMSGGFDNLLDIDHPKESDSDVRAARARGVARLDQATAALVAELGQGTGLRQEARLGGRADLCDKGEHNWKTDTDYDLRCTVERKVLLLGEGARATEQLDALATWLEGSDYRPLYGEGVRLTRDPGPTVHDSLLPSSTRYSGPGPRQLEVVLLANDSPAYRLPFVGDPRRALLLDGVPVDDDFQPAQVVGATRYGVLLVLSLTSFED